MTHLRVSCVPLAPERLDAFYAFVENEAFTDNAHWASCFCVFPYLRDQREGEWDARTAEQNRALLGQLVTSGQGSWVVAYLGTSMVRSSACQRRSRDALCPLRHLGPA